MQLSFTEKKNIRKSFGKLKESLSIPNLIEVQKNSYKELTELDLGSTEFKIPHMGWNELKIANNSKVFKDVVDKNHAYFIHSYEFIPKDKKNVSITTNYGKDVIAAVSFENIFGSQFHPEKSDKTGLVIIKNFLDL